MFDVENVNPPGYVRDPVFIAAFPAVRSQLPLLSGLKCLQRASVEEQKGKILQVDKWIALEAQQRAPSWSGGSQRRSACGIFCANLKPD